MRLNRILAGLAVLFALCSNAPAWGGQLIYGVDGSNNIVTIDWEAKTVITTPVGLGSGGSNGLAYDVANNRLILQYSAGRLYSVGLNSSGLPIGTSTNLGAGPGGTATGATFYGGQYVYVDSNTDNLIKVDVTGTPTVAQTIPNFDQSSQTGFGFGDVAVDPYGILYGSSNQGFFSYNLNVPGSFQMIDTIQNNALQLAMLADGTLVGVSTSTGAWYTINKTTGVRMLVDNLLTPGLTDLASNPVPEPSSIVMLGLAASGLAAGACRRRRMI